MKRLKRQPNPTRTANSADLQTFLRTYDQHTLLTMLNTLETSDFWPFFKSYASQVQRRYEVDALDLAGKNGETTAAAFASGYAHGIQDVIEKFSEGIKQTVLNVSPIVEKNREEEVEPVTSYDS